MLFSYPLRSFWLHFLELEALSYFLTFWFGKTLNIKLLGHALKFVLLSREGDAGGYAWRQDPLSKLRLFSDGSERYTITCLCLVSGNFVWKFNWGLSQSWQKMSWWFLYMGRSIWRWLGVDLFLKRILIINLFKFVIKVLGPFGCLKFLEKGRFLFFNI